MSRKFTKVTWMCIAGALVSLTLQYVDHAQDQASHYHSSRLVRLLAKVL